MGTETKPVEVQTINLFNADIKNDIINLYHFSRNVTISDSTGLKIEFTIHITLTATLRTFRCTKRISTLRTFRCMMLLMTLTTRHKIRCNLTLMTFRRRCSLQIGRLALLVWRGWGGRACMAGRNGARRRRGPSRTASCTRT